MPPSRRPPPAKPAIAEPASVSRLWIGVAAVGLMLGAAGAWLLWPREDKLAAVSEIQKQLLAAGGKPSRADITRVMQTIDRMNGREVGAAYRAAGETWKGIKKGAIDSYFQASPAERPALLDQHIARLIAYHDLLLAMNPADRPGFPAILPRQPRRRRGEPESEKPPGEIAADKTRRELAERFDTAVEAHATSRGIALPEFR